MKWYFAARTKHKLILNKIIKFYLRENHKVVFDWTSLEDLEPYSKNADKSKEIASKISLAIHNTDIFVLISDPAGTDMFVELGIAIACWMQNQKLRIYITGEYNKRSLMHLHPAIIHVNNLKEVFKKECPELFENII